MKINQSGATVDWWGRLVKTDVASPSDSQYLNIDSPMLFNFVLVSWTKVSDLVLCNLTVGYIYILFRNVDMAEEIIPHVEIVGLGIVVFYGIIFV